MQRVIQRWMRLVVVALCGTSIVLAGGFNAPGTAAADGTFTIAVLPDTQHYVNTPTRAASFSQQTHWIVDHKNTQNIVFVSHEGDVVDSGAAHTREWQRADAAMEVLDGVLPYSVVAGNHDYNQPGHRSSGTSTYLRYFGPQRYDGRAWYGGASANGLNQFQIFTAGPWTFLHLGLELEVPDAALAWAQHVITTHPGMPTIITTHAYQNDTTGRSKHAEFQGNSGAQIWQKLIKPNPQIVMVLNGHFHDHDGERHQVSYNAAGQPVYEMVANYQDYPNGGDGYLRLIQFDPGNGRINVTTYSPTLGTYKRDWDSQFSFNVNLYNRFAPAADAALTMGAARTDTPLPTDCVTRTDAPPPTAMLPPLTTAGACLTPTLAPTAPAAPLAVPAPFEIWLPAVHR